MNDSEQDSKVTFGGVTMKQSEVIPEASKTEEKQSMTQSDNRTEDDEKEPILTGQMWADRAYYVLYNCLDNLNSDELPHQPTEVDWHVQGFRHSVTLMNALQILVRDGHIEEQHGKFLMPKRWRSQNKADTSLVG